MRQPVDLDRQRGKAKSSTAQALAGRLLPGGELKPVPRDLERKPAPCGVPKAGLAL
jgi:hypothetical protein